jgi:SPOR domain
MFARGAKWVFHRSRLGSTLRHPTFVAANSPAIWSAATVRKRSPYRVFANFRTGTSRYWGCTNLLSLNDAHAGAIWTRVRIGLSSRQAADSVCAQLEAAGGRCVVQRNTSS